jgi:hypothetical protein
MRRLLTACTGLLLLVSACDRMTEARVNERRVGIYGAVFEAIYNEELGDPPWHAFEQVILNDSICWVSRDFQGHPEVGEVIVAGYGEDVTCLDSFSRGEQAALLAALPGLPNARFTSEPEEVGERIADGDLGGIALMLLVGPIQGVGDRVQVPASSVCGHLCGGWMTFVVERLGVEWKVTGFTGPVGMA